MLFKEKDDSVIVLADSCIFRLPLVQLGHLDKPKKLMVGVSAEVGFGARMGKDLVFRLGLSIYYYYFLQLVLKIKCHFCLF